MVSSDCPSKRQQIPRLLPGARWKPSGKRIVEQETGVTPLTVLIQLVEAEKPV